MAFMGASENREVSRINQGDNRSNHNAAFLMMGTLRASTLLLHTAKRKALPMSGLNAASATRRGLVICQDVLS